MDLYNDYFLRLIRSFENAGVRYLIVGGFAVNHHGYSRATGDLDLYLNDTPENRRNIIGALEEMGYGYLEPILRMPFIAGYSEIMMDDGMYADLMSALPGLNPEDFDEHLKMASISMIEGITVRFLHYNHLIENKKATGRLKDLLDIAELEAIHNRINP